MELTKDQVADLLDNFSNYINPAGVLDPWFRLSEINQQFAWADVPESQLEIWLDELVEEGLVFTHTDLQGVKEWAWQS